jgi:hypothetical protein
MSSSSSASTTASSSVPSLTGSKHPRDNDNDRFIDDDEEYPPDYQFPPGHPMAGGFKVDGNGNDNDEEEEDSNDDEYEPPGHILHTRFGITDYNYNRKEEKMYIEHALNVRYGGKNLDDTVSQSLVVMATAWPPLTDVEIMALISTVLDKKKRRTGDYITDLETRNVELKMRNEQLTTLFVDLSKTIEKAL